MNIKLHDQKTVNALIEYFIQYMNLPSDAINDWQYMGYDEDGFHHFKSMDGIYRERIKLN